MININYKIIYIYCKRLIWLRNIDVIFFTWTHNDEQKLERFLKDLLNFTLKLNLIHEASKNCIPFWDLKFKVVDGKLETDLYIRPTGRCHLHYLSSHPELTKYYVVYIQTLRLSRLCSLKKYFNHHELNMKEWFT